ncbi:PEP-CTERM sorting domain-containing protein [Accumulibacter sp.]|uniref:PEP-CTERM sorting domain-containing protein n=1 Tax=Accumulibacter sp. TaxID=2053492 RepID=UPI002617E0F5|nr:PEP-CTERM sorting domain-containing protein [Accumulibacter sp.]
MKKTMFAAAILALPLAIGGAASAATLATYTHNYGNGVGQVDPVGNDVLSNGYVTVSDQSTERFSDSFDFSSLSFSSISKFDLKLTYSDVGTYTDYVIFKTGEYWSARPGGTDNYSAFNLPASTGDKTITLAVTSSTDTFASMVTNKNFFFWFAEDTGGADAFKLKSAELTIAGVVPEPEAYAMLLVGFGLIGTIARRRSKASA